MIGNKYTIKEIEEKLRTVTSIHDPFYIECLADDRIGVKNLVQKFNKHLKEQAEEEKRLLNLSYYEKKAQKLGFKCIAGVDEVGRGPLAGPIVAAAVILPKGIQLLGVNDSKKLSKLKREELYNKIMEEAISVGIGVIDAKEIDRINIYEATKKAMLQAIQNLSTPPDYLLLDAMQLDISLPQKSIIKGDSLSLSIASASIVAKVYRDRMMEEYNVAYPQYSFDKNVGYGTKEHLEALHEYGPCPIHRESFAPVKGLLQMEFKLY